MTTIGKWGCFHWEEDVLPESMDVYKVHTPRGVPMRCVDERVDAVQLEKKDVRYWIRRSGFVPRPTPDLVWGDKVLVKSKEVEAVVDLVCYHRKEKRYYYHLNELDGKKMKKRYYIEELKKMENGEAGN